MNFTTVMGLTGVLQSLNKASWKLINLTQLSNTCSSSWTPRSVTTSGRMIFRDCSSRLTVPSLGFGTHNAAQQAFGRCAFGTLQEKVQQKARLISVPVGLLAGLFGSVVGVGGGVLISPIIAGACRAMPQKVISGTSLAAVSTTGTAAGLVYWQAGAVDLGSSLVLAAAAIVTAPLGASATRFFDCQALRRYLGWWLILVAPLVPLKSAIFAASGRTRPEAEPAPAPGDGGGTASGTQDGGSPPPGQDFSLPATLALAATGSVAGFASGLLGIGGGTIVTPMLALFTGLPQLQVLGSSLAAMVLPSLVALGQHHRLGNVDWRMAAGLAAGTLVGSYIGSRTALDTPPWMLEAMFCSGMLLLGWRTLAAAGRSLPAAAAAAPK